MTGSLWGVCAITLLFIPALWSIVVRGLRALVIRPQTVPLLRERDELLFLGLMLAPVLAGIVALLLSSFVPAPMLNLPLDFAGGHDHTSPAHDHSEADVLSKQLILDSLMPAVWILYAGGMIFALSRLIRSFIRIHNHQCSSIILKKIDVIHSAESAHSSVKVGLSPEARTPFVTVSGHIIIPQSLYQQLNVQQRQWIIAHEIAHWQRGDPARFLWFALIEVLFWYNPAIKAQIGDCRQQAELACDAIVIKQHSGQRADYARTLLIAIDHASNIADVDQNNTNCVPTIFSSTPKGEYRMRLTNIITPALPVQSQKTIAPIAIFVLVLLLVPMTATQMVFAQSASTQSSDFSIVPVKNQVTSRFGLRKNPFKGGTSYHRGIDIRGDIGDPVVAPAGGVVTEAVLRKNYGYLLTINHGGGYVTRYAQLDGFEVKKGDSVTAGQLIARLGSSGQSTGPHLHFEVLKDGEFIDPETVLTFDD